ARPAATAANLRLRRAAAARATAQPEVRGGGSGARKTLQRVLSRAGACSRTAAREAIAAGRVSVGGKVVRDPEAWVAESGAGVALDGAPLRAAAPLFVLLHKPKDCVTTASDPQGRRTVYDLLSGVPGWVGPVGRLDRDTSGLLLLTNDTALADAITDPASHLPKTYRVKAATLLSDEQLDALRRGVTLSDGPTRPAVVERLRDGDHRSFVELTLTEGRNRQVRRMLQAVGSRVLELRRTGLGPLALAGLPAGRHRALTDAEVAALRQAVGGPPRPARGGKRRAVRG
ncbi:MAG TPA: pseudouridine synthase, partial [Planctomycetota bacterium]|nr:pseudouridine synthase [Planctomycetota bacterium]